MEEWVANPRNKKFSKPGDDRTPPWRWVGCLNYDDVEKGIVTIPSEYIMVSLMGGGTEVSTGKRGKSFKSQSQSGLICKDFHWPLLNNGKTIKMADVNKLLWTDNSGTFVEQKEAVEKLGFPLFVRRAAINGKKHIRVRPRFDNWGTQGEIIITDEQITIAVLQQIFDAAGRKGIGDWRPSAPKKPGSFGMYTAVVTEKK
jgi:hypothetical protein